MRRSTVALAFGLVALAAALLVPNGAGASANPAVGQTTAGPSRTVRGTVTLDTTVTGTGVASVDFVINGKGHQVLSLGEATLDAGHWTVAWDTTTVANAHYSVQARATLDSGGQIAGKRATLVVRNPELATTPRNGLRRDGQTIALRVRYLPAPASPASATAWQCAGPVATASDVAALCDPATAVSKTYKSSDFTVRVRTQRFVSPADASGTTVDCSSAGCTVAVETATTVMSQGVLVFP